MRVTQNDILDQRKIQIARQIWNEIKNKRKLYRILDTSIQFHNSSMCIKSFNYFTRPITFKSHSRGKAR